MHIVKLPHNKFTYVRVKSDSFDLHWNGEANAQKWLDEVLDENTYEVSSWLCFWRKVWRFEVFATTGTGDVVQEFIYLSRKRVKTPLFGGQGHAIPNIE